MKWSHQRVDPTIEILEENMMDTEETLRNCTNEDYKEMEIKLGMRKLI